MSGHLSALHAIFEVLIVVFDGFTTRHEDFEADSDKFEQASIDEAYLDVTEIVKHDWDEAMALARRLQRTIHAKVGLTASFGIGPTRIIAKMSSEVNKPNGIHRVLPDEISEFFEADL